MSDEPNIETQDDDPEVEGHRRYLRAESPENAEEPGRTGRTEESDEGPEVEGHRLSPQAPERRY